AYARQLAEAERIARDAELGAAWAPRRAAVANLAVMLVTLSLAAGIAGLGVYLAALGVSHARFRFRHARPDGAGLLDVPIGQLGSVAPQALGAYHAARIAEAQQQPVPHSLTWSPHYRHDHRADALGTALAPALQPPVELPSFRTLLDGGRVGRGNPMLLGFDAENGAPVEGSWLDLYSCGLGGLSGSGKSWTACFLAAQAALFGTRIVLLDPHAGNAESLAARLEPLAGRFLCAPAESPREMRAAVELVAEELRRRKAGKSGDPLLFIADEYSALQRGELADPLAALVEGLGQEGRKLGLYAMVAGQVWTATRAGGSEVRDSLASAYVHRCRPAQARYLTGLLAADLPGDLLELPAGTAYLLNTAGAFRRVIIPRMDPGDLGRVAEQLAGPASAAPSAAPSAERPIGFRTPGAGSGAGSDSGSDSARATSSPSGRGAALTPEEAQILARFLAGESPGEIAEALAGGKGGRGYADAARRVADVLRRALAGKGAQDG
ncbi:MAG TPA: hypothetical protein PKD53_33845, partial [Chloroflexaceae bacterium]|nr:hypothetical protein [Chloroflexaceae bacterium]